MTKRQIIDYYDQTEIDYRLVWHLDSQMALHFGFWDQTTKNFNQALQRENEILSRLVKIKRSDKVLDAGCGVGGSAIYLAKKYGLRVVGITLSRKQVIRAEDNALKHKVDHLTQFKVMDFTRTSFKNDTFDVIWAIESVCHAQSKEKFIKESFRILKKGGRLIVADGFALKKNFTKKEQVMMKWLKGWGVDFLETTDNFKRFLLGVGFKKITYQNMTKNILPSSKRLYRYFFPAWVITRLAQWLGLRSKIQTGNVISAYYQYQVIKKGLCQYGIFYAKK